MKKFAAIFAAVTLCLSVVMVSASAKLFVDDTVYQYSVGFSGISPSAANAFSCYSLEVFNGDGETIFTWSTDPDSEVLFVRNGGAGGGTYYQPFLKFVVDGVVTSKGLYSSEPITASCVVHYRSSISGQSIGTESEITIPAAVSSLSNGIFGVGDSLISFVTSSWLTLVALGAFLVVLCIGAIRRLVKGV